MRLYTPLDSPLNNASSFSIRGPQTPPSIYDHSARLFLPGATSSPLLSSPLLSSPLLFAPLLPAPLACLLLRGWSPPPFERAGPPSVHGTAAAYYCRGFDLRGAAGGWLASHRPGAASCVSKKNRARATCFPDSSFGNGRRCLIPWWLCFIPPPPPSRRLASKM